MGKHSRSGWFIETDDDIYGPFTSREQANTVYSLEFFGIKFGRIRYWN